MPTRIQRHNQAIVTSYKFDCNQMCGNITEWGVDVRRDREVEQNTYTLDLQVWRPSPTVDDSTGTGQYSQVGNNRFTSISLSDGVAIVTPSPQDYIQFQPGDVLGFYVEGAIRENNGVVVLTDSNFTNEIIWYASIDPAMATTQTVYSVGSIGELDSLIRAAPVISIATGIAKTLITSSVNASLQTTISKINVIFAVINPCPTSLVITTPLTNDTVSGSSTIAPSPEDSYKTVYWIIVIVVAATAIVTLALITVAVIVSRAFKKCRKKVRNFSFDDQGISVTNKVYGAKGQIHSTLR